MPALRAKGHIAYDDSEPVTYGGGGPNPRLPWKVILDVDPANPQLPGWRRLDSAKSYEWAAAKLARELAWRDPRVMKLKAKAEELKEEVRKAEYQRLMDEHAICLADPSHQHHSHDDEDNTSPSGVD